MSAVDHDLIAFSDLIADARTVAERVLPHLSADVRAIALDTLHAGGRLLVQVEFEGTTSRIRLVLAGADGQITLFKSAASP